MSGMNENDGFDQKDSDLNKEAPPVTIGYYDPYIQNEVEKGHQTY